VVMAVVSLTTRIERVAFLNQDRFLSVVKSSRNSSTP
jgi:hypothetical protein